MTRAYRSTQLVRGDLVFDVTEAGSPDGDPVVLLHGFPQFSDSWGALAPLLHAQGYRTVAMDQRGYSPGARPRGRRAYRIPELVADAVALTEHAGPGPVHVVGHDWGAAVAWGLAAARPDRVASLTALSVPHPQAFLRSLLTSNQALKSWYMFAFQLPWLPERMLGGPTGIRLFTDSGQSPELVRRDLARLREPGALTAAVNWYRAMPLVDPRTARRRVRRPTLFIWSDGDVAITRHAAQQCGRYVDAPFRFETLPGVSHWIPEQAPAEVAALLLPHLQRWG